MGRLERRKSSSNSSLPPVPLGKKKRKKGKVLVACTLYCLTLTFRFCHNFNLEGNNLHTFSVAYNELFHIVHLTP